MGTVSKRKWRRQAEKNPLRWFSDGISAYQDDSVLIILATGANYNAISGVVGAVHADYLTLISDNIVTLIPFRHIAAVARLAGGGPLPPPQ